MQVNKVADQAKGVTMLRLVPLFVVLLVLGTPRIGLACSCVKAGATGSEEERSYFFKQLYDAESAFVGSVVSEDKAQLKFKVEQVWKGAVREDLTIDKRPLPAPPPGWDFVGMDCSPGFDVGSTYLAFLYVHPDDGRLELWRCAVWTGEDMQDRLRLLNQGRQPNKPLPPKSGGEF